MVKISRTTRRSVHTLPQLPEDVVIAILEYLPVRSLIRFRCVSKSWYTLIKSPAFINRHLLKQQKNSGTLLVRRRLPNGNDVLSFYNMNSGKLTEEVLWPNLPIWNYIKLLNPFDILQEVRLLGPCNGLVCIVYNDCIVLCNPALREFKQLPPCPYDSPPNCESLVSGEGFGPSTSTKGGFKFVRIRVIYWEAWSEKLPIQFYLYTSITNSWRRIDYNDSRMRPFVLSHTINVFFNNACHWHATKGVGVGADYQRNVILSFDMDSEIFRELEGPDCFEREIVRKPNLMVLIDHLALVRCANFNDESQVVDVWVMKEYGVKESWTKQFVIGPQIIRRPFLSWKNGQHLLVETRCGRLASCAIGGSTDEMEIFQEVYGEDYSLRALIYKEGLISLK